MMTNNNSMPFFPIVQELEEVLGYTEDVMALITLIDEKQFLAMRNKIVDVFKVGEMEPFHGQFGEEIEFGDVSDSVRETTFALYPQGTPMDKPISLSERKEWCSKILQALDYAAISH